MDLLATHPNLIVAAVSGFGQDGPRRDWKSSDLVAQAIGGMVYVNGRPDEPPLRAWGAQSHHAASLHAAIGILLALLARDHTGKGQIVDVSLQESVVSMLEHVGATFHATGEIQERRGTLHWTRTFRTGKCRDGYVLLSILGDWTSLLEWMKADGAGDDFVGPAWESIDYRREHCERLFDALDRWAQVYSVQALVEGAQVRRLPFAPLLAVDDLPRHEQLVARKFFVELDGDIYPGAPYRFSATPWRLRSPAPRCDEHREEILRELEGGGGSAGNGDLPPTPSLARRGTSEIPHLPLHGVRVLDFTWVVAGPLATRVLADHGAEVIKIERPDARFVDRRREALAASLNRNKRSILLDMETVRGVDIARDLVRHCDVVIDNFSSRVMTNWGMSYAELRQLKPDIIALGMSGFGREGPYRDYVSYGPTLQAMAGFTWHMRRPGGEPTGWGFSYSDMVSGYSAAYAVLAALWHRSRTGEGQSIDLAQYEALLTFIGPELVAAASGVTVSLPSTQHGAPEGIYRCRDRERDGTKRDRWCALAVVSDEEWKRCIPVFGNPTWALDPRFASLAGRSAHREEVDARIESWTLQRSA
jgi:crotonobetainyl-CoA:carnitine CoA-transferase CaiB-like acyl-CoA transferase